MTGYDVATSHLRCDEAVSLRRAIVAVTRLCLRDEPASGGEMHQRKRALISTEEKPPTSKATSFGFTYTAGMNIDNIVGFLLAATLLRSSLGA